MTIGSSSYDYRAVIQSPYDSDKVVIIGAQGWKGWSGGDSIKPGSPRSNYLTGPVSPREIRMRQIQNILLRRNLPPNPYEMNRGVRNHAVHTLWSEKEQRFHAANCVQGAMDYYDDPSVEYKVLAKLQQAMYGSGFNPAIFCAEGGQAMRMIFHSAQRIRQALVGLKRGNPRAVLHALGIAAPSRAWVAKVGMIRRKGTTTTAISGLWLEVQYGWRPLLTDAEAAGAWIARAIKGGVPKKLQVSAKHVLEGTISPSYSSPCCYLKKQVRKRVKILVQNPVIAPDYMPSIMTVAQVAWEKLPYSFVADWFVPIGSYLAACGTARSIEGTFITTRSWETFWINPGSNQTDTRYVGIYMGTDECRDFRIERTVATGPLPVPSPFTDLLSKNQGYQSWRHAVNAVALLINFDFSVFRKRK